VHEGQRASHSFHTLDIYSLADGAIVLRVPCPHKEFLFPHGPWLPHVTKILPKRITVFWAPGETNPCMQLLLKDMSILLTILCRRCTVLCNCLENFRFLSLMACHMWWLREVKNLSCDSRGLGKWKDGGENDVELLESHSPFIYRAF
jgi:hypothetical protein